MKTRLYALQCTAILSLSLVGTGAQAALVVSTGPTANVKCSGDICTATAKNAVLNVGDLQSMLANADVTVATGTKAVDVEIAAALTWASTHRLTLDGYESVAVNKHVTVTGPGGLTLVTNDGGSEGSLSFGAGGYVDFSDIASSVMIGSQGPASEVPFTLVNSVNTNTASLAALATAIANNASGNFAFGASYNAGADGTYTSAPVPTLFSGTFEGLGNTINKLTIKDTTENDDVGLFAYVRNNGSVRDIGLVGGVVSGSTGANIGDLAGRNEGTISQSYATGNVTGAKSATVGGLAGRMDLGSVDHSYATGAVAAKGGASVNGGGLVGAFGNGTISLSHATGAVNVSGGGVWAGGLVGTSQGTLVDSYATGDVTATNSTKNGEAYAGGLVGDGQGTIDNDFATGNVSALAHAGSGLPVYIAVAGGLVGDCGAPVSNSYATGDVSGTALGKFRQVAAVGGFVGFLEPGWQLTDSYSTGMPKGSADADAVGGSIGYVTNGSDVFSDIYWDTTTSQTDVAVGYGQSSGITGLTTAEFQAGLPAGFDSKVWAEKPNLNEGLPYLLLTPPPK